MTFLALWIIAIMLSTILIGLGFALQWALKKEGDSRGQLIYGIMWAVFAVIALFGTCVAITLHDVDTVSRLIRIITLAVLTNFMVMFSIVNLTRNALARKKQNRPS